ncbi:AarF/UbiB family protein [Lentibacillus sp. N15]|uniref:ABC1 kinase family protein n=1 Tax=Lentibacillus songyuanensis TaxID=3136161 RepID=UPI0031BAECA4
MQNTLKYNVIYRCTVIVWMTVKFMLQLYFFHIRHRIWDEKTNQKWNDLLRKMAQEYRVKAVNLGGVLIKVGQFLSTRADLMPDVFIQELTGLVDRVPPAPFSYARNVMETEWHGCIDDYFAEILEKPIASASIGQVYQGRLHDGSLVAIKIRRYRVKETFQMDFKALKIVFWLIRVFTKLEKVTNLHTLYREMVFVMDRELNFNQELTFGEYFKERYKDYPLIYIPDYYAELCTDKVLVMEWVTGAKITDTTYMSEHQISVKQTAKTLFDFYFDQFFNPGYFHADPHAGNILIQPDGTLAIIDFGMIGEIRKQDTQLFKRLVQGIIVDDYDKILKTLDEMNFILPNADRDKLVKIFKQTIDMYQNGTFKDMDARLMEQIKDDIRVFINEQPIQLSADYAYLGRAISIVVGVLISIYPDIDLGKWSKLMVKQWFGCGKTFLETVYKEIAMDTVKPILSLPKAMLGFLENGEKDRKWQREKQQTRLQHQFYLLLEIIMFVLVVGSSLTGIYAYQMGMSVLLIISVIVLVVFFFMLHLLFFRHYHMIRLTK